MKRTALIGIAILVACSSFAGQEYKAEEVRQFAEQDIKYLSGLLEDFLSEGNAFPVQRGPFNPTAAIYKALAPKHAESLPVMDKWGKPYQVYLGEAVNGVYGFKDRGPEDFLVASFGKDGRADAWRYDPSDPEGGFYPYHSPDGDLDIVLFDGEVIRGPKMAEIEELRIAAMKDIFYLTESLTSYILDAGNTYPEQKGEFTEDSPIYRILVAKYPTPGGVPTTDPWGHPYGVFLGEAIRGVYGIQDNEPDDCLVVSYGADGKPDDWRYDPKDPGGMYPYDSPEVDNDIIWYSGVLIRGPQDNSLTRPPALQPALRVGREGAARLESGKRPVASGLLR